MPSVTMPDAASDTLTFPANWHRRDLLDLETLSADEITMILDVAQQMKEMTDGCRSERRVARGEAGDTPRRSPFLELRFLI